MNRTIREYHRPADVAEALGLLQRAGVRTAQLSLGPRVPDEPLAGVEAVVDLSRLKLDAITETIDGSVHIGAGVSLQGLVDSALLQSLADGILPEAATLASGSAMRHAATVGGTLLYARQAAAGAVSDGPPELIVALMVLGADAVLHQAGLPPVAVDLGQWLATGGGVADGGLLVGVRFGRPSAGGHAALARVARTPRDQAIVAAAALIDGDTLRLAVASGGTAPPQRILDIEHALASQSWTAERLEAVAGDAAAAMAPHTDFRASAEYRSAMVGVLVRRALADAATRAGRLS